MDNSPHSVCNRAASLSATRSPAQCVMIAVAGLGAWLVCNSQITADGRGNRDSQFLSGAICDALGPERVGVDAKPVFAVYISDPPSAANAAKDEPRLIAAVWDDKHIMISADSLGTTTQYREGVVSSADFERLVGLCHSSLCGISGFDQVPFHHAIEIMCSWHDGEVAQVVSMHPLYESQFDKVFLQDGVHSLSGRSVVDVWEAQATKEYVCFRYAWERCMREVYEIGARSNMAPSHAVVEFVNY